MRILMIWTSMLALACAASQRVELPGSPFKIVVSSDGTTIYASMIGNGLAVLKRSSDGVVKWAKTVKTDSPITGLALTHDGRMLIASDGKGILLVDPEKGSLIHAIEEDEPTGSVYVNVTADDKTVFVSNERAHSITVIDLPTRKIIGRIQTGNAPIALTFSPDERFLYTTSQAAMPDWDWPTVCDAEQASNPAKHPHGAVLIIDVTMARKDPSHAVTARVEAGCNPVRLALSPDGRRAYVTTRKDNAVLVFETAKFEKIATIPVGTAPVPVAVIQGGAKVLVGNSNRFSAGEAKNPESVSIIDARTNKAVGTLPAGAFPRDIVLSPDKRTIYIANFGSKAIDVWDSATIP